MPPLYPRQPASRHSLWWALVALAFVLRMLVVDGPAHAGADGLDHATASADSQPTHASSAPRITVAAATPRSLSFLTLDDGNAIVSNHALVLPSTAGALAPTLTADGVPSPTVHRPAARAPPPTFS